MNRLLYILILLLPLTACQRAEKSADSLSSEQQLDSLLASKACEFIRAYAVEHQMYYLEESTFVPSKISDRLFESWYDDGCFLLLVNRKDTSVLDILYDMPIAPNVAIFLEGVNITDSAWMEHWQKDECRVVSDTLIIDRFMIYTYHQSDWNTDKTDTLFMTKTETRYRIDNEKFVYESQQKERVEFYKWVVEYFFLERDYNERLNSLYRRICAGDTISNDELLEAMPQTRGQFFLACAESWYGLAPYNRDSTIEQMAYERTAEDRRFMDAFIKEAWWSDGAASEILFEGYFPKFRTYDSLYFDSVVYRLLSPCDACYAIHGIDYEGQCPGCE